MTNSGGDGMKKYVFKKTAGKVTDQARKEGATARKAVKGLAGIIPGIFETLIGIIPKMIRLSVELIKSEKVSDNAKLILMGTICVTGFAVADEFVSRVAVFPLVFILLGPFSAVISIAFFGTIKLLLMVACFFVAAHIFNTAIEHEEMNKLVKQLFGEKNGTQFMSDLQALYQRLQKYLSPFIDRLMRAFGKIGKRKKELDPEETGEAVIHAAAKNRQMLLGWSGSVASETTAMLSELDEKESDQSPSGAVTDGN
jgi:hypothetical protein